MTTRVAIVGAGIAGSAAAYHQARAGWRDVTVIDRGEIAAATGVSTETRRGLAAGARSFRQALSTPCRDVIEDERLVDNAAVHGAYLLERLRALRDQHPRVGDVLGQGLLAGVEPVTDRESKRAAESAACRSR